MQEQETAPEISTFIELIYNKILERQPDETGAQSVKDAIVNGQNVLDIIESFMHSEEAQRRRVTTFAIAHIYQELLKLPEEENIVPLDSMQEMLTKYFQKRYFDDEADVYSYPGSIWIDRARRTISGWILFDDDTTRKQRIQVKIPGAMKRVETIHVVGGIALIDIPINTELKAQNYAVFDASKDTILVRAHDVIQKKLLIPKYYVNKYPDAENASFKHYIEVGFDAGYVPNPFAIPDVIRKSGVTLNDTLALTHIEDNIYLCGLIDIEYCASSNGIAPGDAIHDATVSLMKNEWIDFHPLLTETDFKRSGEDSILKWLRRLCDPGTSLVGLPLDRFSPVHYRNTCAGIEYENELVDYLFSTVGETGEPHVFFNSWYTTQHLSPDFDWPRRGLWADSFVHPSKYNFSLSPFWNPLAFQNVLITEHGVSALAGQCALDLFLEQEEILLAPSTSVLPSAIMHAFLGRPLERCENKMISGRDIVLGLEEALNRKTGKPQAPALSVCILNYNKPSFSLLSAIAAATNADQEVEVLVLDNGSSPIDFAVINRYTEKLGNVRVIRSQKNLFFGEGNNVLVDRAAADKVLFLNNDAFVGPDTINGMLNHLDATPEASAVGPTFLFPNLEIQEAAGTISNCGRQVQLHKHTSFRDHLKYMPKDPIEGVQYVSAACVCIRTEVLKDIGGFDYIYEPFYFEDTDLCKRMESLGYRLDYLPGSFVIHYENASTREFLSTGFMSQIEKNRMKFQGRWLYKTKGFKPRYLIPEVTTEPLPDRKTAVVYTPFDISLGGGERYILSCALALSREYNVVLCSNSLVSNTRISFVLKDLGLETPGVGSIRTDLFEDISGWEDVEVMIAMGNEVIPPVPFNAKVNIFHCQYPFPSHHSDRFEVNRLRKVDAFFVNSEFTKRKVDSEQRQLSFDIPVVVTGAPVRAPSESNEDASRDDDSLFRLINVGRFEPLGHSKRQDITIEIFREFYAGYNDASLSLIGAVGGIERREEYVTDLRRSAKGLPVTFDLDASSTLLSAKLKSADVLIHSCGYDIDVRSSPERLEHFGIVILEAMANGAVPLVYGAGGPAEIVNRFGVGYTFRTVSEAAERLMLISELTRKERQTLAARAKEAAAHFFDGAFQDAILDNVSRLMVRGAKV